jgi:chromosomal replication initiator protein DnaA
MLGFKRERQEPFANEGAVATAPKGESLSGASGTPETDPAKRLGEILIEEGLLNAAQLAEALSKQEQEGGFIGEVLVRLGFVKQNAIVSCLVKQCKIPHLNLLDYEVTKEVLKVIPQELCIKHNLLPIDKLGRILTIAMVNPFDTHALEEIRAVCPELRIKPILCDWDHFHTVMGRIYTGSEQSSSKEASAESFGLRPELPKSKQPQSVPAAPETRAAMAATVNSLLEDAANNTSKPSVNTGRGNSAEDAKQLSAVVRESVGGAIQEVMATLMEGSKPSDPKGAAASGYGGDEMARLVRKEMDATLGPALTELREMARSAAPTSTPEEIAETIRQSVGFSMQEVLAQVVTQLKASPPESGHGEPLDISSLNEMVRSTVRDVIRESEEEAAAARANERMVEERGLRDIDELVKSSVREAMHGIEETLTAQANRRDPEERSLDEMVRTSVREAMHGIEETLAAQTIRRDPEERNLDEMVKTSVREALHGIETALTAQVNNREKEEHDLDEMVKASVREALRESEEAAVSRMNRRELEERDAERLRKQKHSSVTSFSSALKQAAIQGNPDDRLEADERVMSALKSDRLIPGFTFDVFCVGKSNAFTYKLCRAVSEKPGGEYNPFFIYGDVGLGKTHIINAMGNAVLSANPESRVGYVSSSRFASRMSEAAREDALDAFRSNYCHWDVLILDDIQFLGGRVEAQEEFFHIFNVLQQEERQIIIAGDKPPDRLGMLEQRLISRFAGGIVVNLRPPEWETRMAILRNNVKRSGAAINDEVVSLIAMRVPNDVRKMIGALKKIIAYAELANEPISCETANEILVHLGIEEAA